ncbi:glycogenin [Paecilomyces variotii No. 5]|uniref:glycogenin glucosyltransferase n=1 Tax=Byssochlamys spectabilis (strain No. 5 / NBRC 109023) TaxID=1356009 RepID=V5FIY5_BYSSN|nr:glycogenin [Paecilomyces variotii No. 5]
MAAGDGAVYCTLLMSDNYLPGAAVLAHSLRDNGTKAKLVALYTPETLQPATISELKSVYDEIIPVNRIINATPANLWLMNRPDLISTFTKIQLWRQTQFKRIVYIDCDVVAVRAPDELLSLDADFAAAPDVGWPDIFNSGVMVLRPNMQDYYSLVALAERGISFDGADQGLFNMHFKNWHRLSFTYNCTPSANYQYIPAYKHFQSTISMLHFIGSQKPWNLPRQVLPREAPYNQLLGRWWAIYDRHYRPEVTSYAPRQSQTLPESIAPYSAPPAVETFDRPSVVSSQSAPIYQPAPVRPVQVAWRETDQAAGPAQQRSESDSHVQPSAQVPEVPVNLPHNVPDIPPQRREQEQARIVSAVPQYVRGEEHVSAYIPLSHEPQRQGWHPHQEEPRHEQHVPSAPAAVYQPPPQKAPSPEPQKERPFSPPQAEWDASREPPPQNSRPEAMGLQSQTYTMSEDTKLFQPPETYPEAPKDMWYKVPETKPEPRKIAPIFPWETRAPKPTRVFPDEVSEISEPQSSTHPQSPSLATDASGPSAETPSTPPYAQESSDPWTTYTRSNAWDEVPEISKYIETIQQSRKAKTQVISGAGNVPTPSGGAEERRGSLRITDFPSEVERPSLPVTPAPVRPATFWGQDEDETSTQLPAAEGVPGQEEWVGLTVDVFAHLLRVTYLYWRLTESDGTARRAQTPSIRATRTSRFTP